MTDSQDSGPGSFIDPPSVAEVKAAEGVIAALMAALRNYGLFPPEHTSTANLLESIHKSILNFTGQFEDLGFGIEKTSLIYEEIVVFDGDPSDENPAYVLYRDGIRWIQFADGLEIQELESFFRLFNHYRVMPDEPEDDLVSALWREDLPHILYLASDDLWDVEPVLDFSVFDLAGQTTGGSELEQEMEERESSQGDSWESIRPDKDDAKFKDLSVSRVASGEALWHLDPEEKEILKKDIQECVEQESREDVIGLMLLILNSESEPEFFESIIKYLKEEFRISLINKDFGASFLLLGNMKKIQEAHNGTKEWAHEIFDKFYEDLVKPEVLTTLIPVWHQLSTLDPTVVKNFTRVLRLLPPKAGETFAGMINKVSSPNARSLMIEIIASFATRDMAVLGALLVEPEEDLGLRLVRVIMGLADQDAAIALMRQASSHPRSKVRNEAQKSLYKMGGF